MVELADTPDLGSGAKACRFKSCYPYQLQAAQQCGLFDFYNILTVDKTVTVYPPLKIRKFSLTKSIWYVIINNRQEFANMAQSAEHILGKDEVPGSNPGISSR